LAIEGRTLHMEGHSSDIDDPAPGSKERALLIEEPAMVIEGCKTVKGRPTSAYDVLCGSGCDSNLSSAGSEVAFVSVLCVRYASLPSLRSFVWRVPTLPV